MTINPVYIDIESCNKTNMCVHNVIKGYDELSREVLDTKYTYDCNDNCDYTEPSNSIQTDHDDLTIMHLNIRGLYSKLGQLTYLIDHLLANSVPDVVTLCETWLSKHTPNFIIPGYKVYRSDRLARKGGGVCILVRQGLISREITDIPKELNGTEICSVEIKTSKGQLGILSLYRPPNTNPHIFCKTLETLAKKVRKNCKEIIVGLDHNLDFLKSNKHNPTNDFIEKVLDLNLLLSITRPTRITKSTATLIDNILVDHRHCESLESYVITDDISDHLPCVTILKEILINKHSKVTINCRDTHEKCIKRLQESLCDQEWGNLYTGEHDVNSLAEQFHSTLCSRIDRFCPERKRLVNYSKLRHEPWLTNGIMTSISKSKKLYKATLCKNVKEEMLDKYHRYNKQLQKVKRASKKLYYQTKCNEFRSNTRKLWKTINKLCNSQNDKSSVVSLLKIGDRRCGNSQLIADEFGNYFSNVGESYAKKIKKSNKNIHDYLGMIQNSQKSIFMEPCTVVETKRLLTSLPNKGSSGVDNINNILLKKIANEVATPLTHLINSSIEQGVFPDIMKCALVVPLYKAKSREDVTNYRPISLLMTLSKVIEKVVYKRVYNYLHSTGQLYESQYGFCNNHSCEHTIGELLGNIVKNQQLGKDTVSIMLDLSKAFDTLQHTVIFQKLEKYGIRGPALAWFKSYLTNRTLCVKCTDQNRDNHISKRHKVLYGMPQGSCMGPLIFLVFCNDLHLHLQFMESIQFTDDTMMYLGHSNLNYLRFFLETDMLNINDWFCANKLTLNIEKTVVLHFTRKSSKCTRLETIEIGSLKLKVATFAKFLGLWIDEHLNWKEHVR